MSGIEENLSWKCNCGLLNWEHHNRCRRCDTPRGGYKCPICHKNDPIHFHTDLEIEQHEELSATQQKLESAEAECFEQARLNGMGGEREARLIAENAELTRKLAEQQVQLLRHTSANGCNVSIPCDSDELTKLLEEAKRKAVPDDVIERLNEILNWCDAYPLEVFPEPDFKKAAMVLKENGMTVDAISASSMRHVLNGVKGLVQKAILSAAQQPSPETDIDQAQRYR